MSLGNETSEKYQASMHLHLRAAEDKHGDSVSALCWRGLRRSSSTFGYAAWAGMACSGGSTASRGWWRGRGITAAAVALGARRREVGALDGGDVDGGGARLARWGEQDGRR